MGVWPSLLPAHPQSSLLTGAKRKSADMDAIRKKMQSLKSETDGLYNTIAGFEEATREAAARADQADCDIRDYGKKVQQLEIGFDETNDKLTKATESLEEAEKQFKEVESDVSALTRRIMLMEEEDKKAAEQLCQTITKLALTSKAADNVMKTIKVVENTCLNNEVTIEELDKNLRATVKMASDNEQSKYKVTEARFEYGEMNITKLNQRIDDIEDEIYREKLKIKKCSDELDDTFDDMISNY